ncbi:uncharacterized protein C8Q71DRAFT_114732 [Rhodofomes roseus]|uniref:Uncharacterized protein n=1 Tax=Rhodofomes roseus TaxID=34475 RepID=A0ABQ8KCM3_9APHY|nr:uncharacterized protein C8Q71DRAFT_114732 [Rhodofomes roseus]KAH9835349.1 hypothetical protein C8Q71DRAFT_114732 [Rhodofomes roseus]
MKLTSAFLFSAAALSHVACAVPAVAANLDALPRRTGGEAYIVSGDVVERTGGEACIVSSDVVKRTGGEAYITPDQLDKRTGGEAYITPDGER